MFGFLELAGVARGSDVRDATINYKDSSNNTGHTDKPLDEISDHITRFNTAASGGTVADIAATTNKGNANGAHDDIGGHNDSKTNKGVSEGLAAGGGFVRITTRENIEIATIDDVAKDEIGGNNSNIGSDISGDSPDIVFDVVFGLNDDATIPRGEAEKIATSALEALGGKGRIRGQKTKYRGDKSDNKPRKKNFLS